MEPVRVVPLVTDLGTVEGHGIVLLSLEVYDRWADLRFARIDRGASRPLPRRVPPAEAWTVSTTAGVALTVVDAVGRGDRAFSNGEVRLDAAPTAGTRLDVQVVVHPGTTPLRATIQA